MKRQGHGPSRPWPCLVSGFVYGLPWVPGKVYAFHMEMTWPIAIVVFAALVMFGFMSGAFTVLVVTEQRRKRSIR